MSKNKDELIKDTNKKIKAYQRLSLYSAIPGVVDFASIVIGLISGKPMLLLSTALTRFCFVNFSAIEMAYLSLFVSLGIAAIFVALAFFAIKGKLFAIITSSALYLADTVFLILMFIFKLGGEGFDNNFVFMCIIHGLFLVIFGLAITFYILATKALRREGIKR